MMTHGELFAGIGGFGLAFDRAGMETKWHVEIDEHCQGVLRRHWSDTPIYGDIRDCGKHNLDPVDVITFGSPCQDLSIAGKRKGLKDGERSNLFFEAIRIVDELEPAFAVWENVYGAFSSNAGRDFAVVLDSFRKCGARDIAWRVLDAQYFGIPQRRRRIFLVADFRGERAAQVLFEPTGLSGNPPSRSESGQEVAYTLRADASRSGDKGDGGINQTLITAEVAPTLDAGYYEKRYSNQQFFAQNGEGFPIVQHRMGTGGNQIPLTGVRRLMPIECERLQGFPDGWTDGQKDTHRYKQTGNAVAVPPVEWIAKRIVQYGGKS